MEYRVRTSDDLNHAEDPTYAIDSMSPISFALSDVSSSDFSSENNFDIIDQAGPSTSGSLLEPTEPFPPSGVGVDLSPGSPNMVKPYACDRCSKSFDKQYQLK